VGKTMAETTVKMDEKGRIVIPRRIRKSAQLKEGTSISIRSIGKTIILEPIELVADKYFGAFKVTNWFENLDLDEYVVEVKEKLAVATRTGAKEIVSNDKDFTSTPIKRVFKLVPSANRKRPSLTIKTQTQE
jgi:AbrB family looped-hinge helix DNA binding protein